MSEEGNVESAGKRERRTPLTLRSCRADRVNRAMTIAELARETKQPLTPQQDLEKSVGIEISENLSQMLQQEYERLRRESNPAPPQWEDYLAIVLSIGLERLQQLDAAKSLALLERGG